MILILITFLSFGKNINRAPSAVVDRIHFTRANDPIKNLQIESVESIKKEKVVRGVVTRTYAVTIVGSYVGEGSGKSSLFLLYQNKRNPLVSVRGNAKKRFETHLTSMTDVPTIAMSEERGTYRKVEKIGIVLSSAFKNIGPFPVKKHDMQVSLMPMTGSYQSPGTPNVTDASILLRGEYIYRSRGRLRAGFDAFITAIDLKNSSGAQARTYGGAAFVGAQLIDTAKMNLALFGGAFTYSLAVSNNSYGFQYFFGPQLKLLASKPLGKSDRLTLKGAYTLALTAPSIIFSNYHAAVSLSWDHMLGSRIVTAGFEWSKLQSAIDIDTVMLGFNCMSLLFGIHL